MHRVFEVVLTALRQIGQRFWSLVDYYGAWLIVLVSEFLTWAKPQIRLVWRRVSDWVQRLTPRGWAKLGAAAVIALGAMYASTFLGTFGHWYDNFQGNRPLMAAKTWYYRLDKIDVDEIAKSTADVLVVDFAKQSGKVPLTKEEVARLKVKPDGQKRIVLSYMSIGEAEEFRFYWRDSWKGDDMPGWEVAENCAWPKAHMVRYWHDGWKDVIYAGRRPYVQQIVDAGFDGVYLDRVDVWEQQVDKRPTAREDMIDFVVELAEKARALKPGFFIVPQNGDALLEDKRYRDVIDALGKEDLLYGQDGTGVRNGEEGIQWSLGLVRLLQGEYKPVFAVEYLTTKEAIGGAEKEMRRLGLVPTFEHRSLDGWDPTVVRPDEKKHHGTPEWIAANCKDKPHW